MYAEAAGRGPAGPRREHARWGGPRRHWVRAGLGVARRGMRMTGRGRCVSAGAARSGLCAVRADAQRGAGAPRRARARGAPADGRREVRVERRGQAVVRILGRRGVAAAKVGRLRHAARGQDAQQRVEVGVVRPHRRVQRRGQRLRWGRTRAQPRARVGPHARAAMRGRPSGLCSAQPGGWLQATSRPGCTAASSDCAHAGSLRSPGRVSGGKLRG